jgi:hypothetical protein
MCTRPIVLPVACLLCSSVDMVVCLGDCLNLLEEEQGKEEVLAAAEAELSQVVTCLENIKCRVVYIPGNVRAWWGGEVGWRMRDVAQGGGGGGVGVGTGPVHWRNTWSPPARNQYRWHRVCILGCPNARGNMKVTRDVGARPGWGNPTYMVVPCRGVGRRGGYHPVCSVALWL